jgi:hypothetical protein
MSRRSRRVSHIVSLLLNPSLWTGGFFLVLVNRFEPAGPRRWLTGSIAVLFTLLMPLGVLFVLQAKGRVSDIEMRIRAERTPVYLWCAASYALGLGLFVELGTAWPLTALMALLLPSALVLTLLNRWWKVSIHAATLAGLSALGIALFGPVALPFALVVPLAVWARWAAGAHTPHELLAGVVVGAGSAVLGLEAALALVRR